MDNVNHHNMTEPKSKITETNLKFAQYLCTPSQLIKMQTMSAIVLKAPLNCSIVQVQMFQCHNLDIQSLCLLFTSARPSVKLLQPKRLNLWSHVQVLFPNVLPPPPFISFQYLNMRNFKIIKQNDELQNRRPKYYSTVLNHPVHKDCNFCQFYKVKRGGGGNSWYLNRFFYLLDSQIY